MRALLEKRSSSNVSEAAVQLVKKLKVPVTAATVIEQVESHADFPSLYSISDNLTKWKVENAAFTIEAEKLDSLPLPFIAHTRKSGGAFILVNNVDGTVDFINERGKEEKWSREDFLKNWTNTVLLAEKRKDSGENEYAKHKKKELLAGLRIPLFIAAGLVLVALYTILNAGTNVGLAASLLLLTKLAGCTVASLLLWFEVDKANPVVQQFCTGSKNTNCTAVLSSKGSKLFSWLSWSEVGFFYFTGSFLSLLLTAYSLLPTLSLLAWLNLIALPYTIFSVYYQWRIAKQWCPLCLSVQALLLTEFVICYLGYWSNGSNQLIIPSANWLITFTSFFLPALFWVATKKVYLTAQSAKSYKKEAAKLRYNEGVFTALLQKQKAVILSTEGLGICLGNPAAKHTLIKVCNPYCGPCAKAHKVIDELLETNEVNVQIIFMVADDDNEKARVVKHLMAIQQTGDEAKTKMALDDWYEAAKKDYDAFKNRHPLPAEINTQGEKLNAMKRWCDETGIVFTPTLFINGYQLPDVYRIDDLKHLL